MLFMTKPIQSQVLFCFKNIGMPMPYWGSCDRFYFRGLKKGWPSPGEGS